MNLTTAVRLPEGAQGLNTNEAPRSRARRFLAAPWLQRIAAELGLTGRAIVAVILALMVLVAFLSLLARGLPVAESWAAAPTAYAMLAAGLLIAGLRERRQGQRMQEMKRLQSLHQATDPRLGVQHARLKILEHTRDHFAAQCCALEVSDSEGRRWLYCLFAGASQIQASVLQPGQSAAQLLPAGPHLKAVLTPGLDTSAQERWLYLSSPRARRRADARFLKMLAVAAALELDRSESSKAVQTQASKHERQRLALDLHDSVIQPYIGLRMAIDALRMQSAAGLPIGPALERVSAMCSHAIDDLRRCTHQLQQPPTDAAPLLVQIEQQAMHMHRVHGVQITVRASGVELLNERLGIDLMHMVREGLSNICRHTRARSGQVRIDCDGRWLRLCISNEGLPAGGSFTPRSISQRAAALGGRALVRTEEGGHTAVHIRLPL